MEQNKSSIGSIIGTIIIIAIIILGGLYFWGKQIEEKQLTQNITSQDSSTTTVDNSEASAIKSTTSVSDDLNSINADLQNTNTTDLAPEVNTQ